MPLTGRLVGPAAALALIAASGPFGCSGDPPRDPGEIPVRSPPAGAPNVLVIVTDDQRAPLAGMPKTRRWFARGGRTYRNAVVTTPLCCPSRASIMTGRYTHNHGVVNNGAAERLDEATTMQRYLRDVGYRTAIVGKFLNRWDLDRPPAYFERFAIFNKGYYDTRWNVDGEQRDEARYTTSVVGDVAVGYLRAFDAEADGVPWYLYVAPNAPHRPGTPAPEDEHVVVPAWDGTPGTHERDLSDKPPWVAAHQLSDERAEGVREGQVLTLLEADDLVDRLMAELGRLGETEDTLAVFLSDNGTFWGEHGLTGKRFPYAEAVRVPLLIRWPGRVRPGSVDHRLVANVDVAPTVLEAAGIRTRSLDPPLDGRSLLGGRARRWILLEFAVDPGTYGDIPDWAAVWDGEREYVEYHDAGGSTILREYYDLRADPWQLHNVLGSARGADDPGAAELSRLSAALERFRRCSGSRGPSACP